jgi:hypothetical protein
MWTAAAAPERRTANRQFPNADDREDLAGWLLSLRITRLKCTDERGNPTWGRPLSRSGCLRRRDVVDFVFRSRLSAGYHRALEELVFFNPRQRDAEAAITEAVDLYGAPAIVEDETGLRVIVGKRDDVQCLFALAAADHRSTAAAAPGTPAGELELAGIVMYLRISSKEIVVLHIGVAEAHCRSRRSGLAVVSALVRTVRAAARRLRGVERLTMLYLQGRQFRIAIGSGSPRPATADIVSALQPIS